MTTTAMQPSVPLHSARHAAASWTWITRSRWGRVRGVDERRIAGGGRVAGGWSIGKKEHREDIRIVQGKTGAHRLPFPSPSISLFLATSVVRMSPSRMSRPSWHSGPAAATWWLCADSSRNVRGTSPLSLPRARSGVGEKMMRDR